MICEQSRQVDIRHWKGGWPAIQLPDGRFVEVVSTPCHFGRERFWFLCPECGRRCAILYPWACRICAGGRYESERMSPENRLIAKAFKIRDRLGQTEGGLFGRYPKKPKGMHWTTYIRLVTQLREVEEKTLLGAAARFGISLEHD